MNQYRRSDRVWAYMERYPLCAICGKPVPFNVGVHHWRTVGAGGSDEDCNLDRLMPNFHKEAHRIGIKEMAIKYKLKKPRDILLLLYKWTDVDEKRWNGSKTFAGQKQYDIMEKGDSL